jgi:hypothetical protein
MNLTKLVEEHAPHPLGAQIQEQQNAGAGNCNVLAQKIAVRSCPLGELPEGLREARAELDAAETAKTEASRKMDERLRDWGTYQNLLNEISERRKHLAFAQERHALAKDAVTQLPANFLAIPRIGEPAAWAGAIELVRDALVCRELVKLLPPWIEAESAELDKLSAAASKLEEQYGE